MADTDNKVVISMAWWWTYLYWPMAKVWLWCGCPVDEDHLVSVVQRAVRMRVAK